MTLTAPRKYASALLRLLPPAEGENAWAALDVLSRAYAQIPALRHFCAHPQVSQAEKETFLTEVLRKERASEVVQRFVLLLLEQGQLAALPTITKSLRADIDAREGVQAIQARTAAALSEAQKKRLQSALEKRFKTKVRMAFALDPALLGGVLVRTDERVLDGTVRGRLDMLREKLLAE